MRRSNAFYGDSGTVFNGAAREQMDEDLKNNSSHGDTASESNNVDFSQRYAHSEADDEEQEFASLPAWAALSPKKYGLEDAQKRERFNEWQRKKENGELPPSKNADVEEKPFNSEEFWSDPEEVKRAGKAVRPPKL